MEFNFLWLILGAGLVFWGKRLFWVFIGAAGFVFGLTTSQSLIADKPVWFYLVAGAICAGALVILIKLLKNVAFGLGGFVLGAYLANGVLQLLEIDLGVFSWVVLIVAGIIGSVMMLRLFDWALIILSSSVGALLVTQAIPGGEAPGIQILFFGLILLGFIVQSRKDQPPQYSSPLPPNILT